MCHRWVNSKGENITFEMGPFIGFRTSTDKGISWTESNRNENNPLFPEKGRCMGEKPIKIGSPHFVDFGKNMQYSPDGYAYLVGHGTDKMDGIANWSTGDAVYLTRVKPSIETMNYTQAYEYFAGYDATGKPVWSKSFSEIKPLINWPAHCGIVNMTYNPNINKYLCFICVGNYDGGGGTYDTWIAEADNVWGPFRKVCYLEKFGQQAYFVCMPSKFISAQGNKFVLFYSANWASENVKSDPDGSGYGLCVGEFELIKANIKK